ncbi:hypothetical protein PG985_011002 [Apiospora marii]|uniref:uncharacterized protein n=1 Tax=Apiospora marii TaxID=335849 RepID=UPI00312DDEB7
MAPNGTTLSPEMTDHWPDCRWKIADSTDAGYPNEPWAHSQNVQQSFFSARFSKRRVFLEHLTPERKERIEHELDRIGKVRRRFVIDDNKKALMETLRSTLDDWRKCVATGKEAMMEQIDKEALLKGYYKSNRHERECEILRRCNVSAPGTEDQAMVIHGRSKRRQSKAKIGKARGTKAEAQQAPKTLPIAESVEEEKVDEPEPLYGLKACAISYGGYTFPNQKIAMHKILESTENNPLMERCPMDCIRYFHFPTNNMEWIERAIARYYNEEPKPLDDKHHAYRPDGRKTEKLLSREFWRGQMHGSSAYGSNSRTELGNASYPAEDWARKGGPIHARHMRSKCAIIPRDTMSQSGLRQGSSAPTLREGSTSSGSNSNPERPFTRGKNIALFLPYMHWETSSRRAKMVEVINETIDHKKKDPKLLDIAKKIRGKSTSKVKTEPKPWKRLLATYLFTLAQVAEQMDYEADERLLRDFVKADPPLHIRRTLDQYYFVTLDDTSQRDKDQVVYRGTLDKKRETKSQSRVVMVDQLWLWILDDNTIITSFPRRWGRNKPDPSGVHKSLRERFEAHPEDIRSIHHLALIIVDQCSRVFFDRTKPLDQRPEVMDIFASAIAHVDQMTAVAYDTFWRNTNLYNKDPLRKVVGTKYLDINPEGALLKEAQDIAEELKMMKRIYNEQLKVVKDFKRHLIHPQGRQVGKGDSASQLQKLLLDLIEPKDKQEDGDEEENDDPDTTRPRRSQSRSQVADETLHEAEGVLELVKSRRTEIIELEQSVLHTCRQLEGFLTLKQQQASIVEAKAALERAEESVKQGRAIMAFTIVTIFFASAPFPYSPTPNFYTDLLTCYALDSYRWVSSQPSSE